MLKVLVTCANGEGTGLMMKMAAEKIINSFELSADIQYLSITDGKNSSAEYDLCFCPDNFTNLFTGLSDGSIHVVGLKNILSQAEMREKLLESSYFQSYLRLNAVRNLK